MGRAATSDRCGCFIHKMDNNYTVYKHTAPNGKVYIGITFRKPETRWSNGNGYSRQKHFYAAIKKYGWENIKHEILFENLSKEDACQKEIELIAQYKSNDPEFGYNQSLGGENGNFGRRHSEETKQKMSEAQKGEKNHGFGKHLSEETKAKLSKANKGKIISEETRKKISEAKKGKTSWIKGKHWTPEMRAKMSERQKGVRLSEETKKKISEADKGKPLSKEHVAKIAEANKKTVICIETGELFNSVKEAAEYAKVNQSHLSNVLCGRSNTAGGYHWEYIE